MQDVTTDADLKIRYTKSVFITSRYGCPRWERSTFLIAVVGATVSDTIVVVSSRQLQAAALGGQNDASNTRNYWLVAVH